MGSSFLMDIFPPNYHKVYINVKMKSSVVLHVKNIQLYYFKIGLKVDHLITLNRKIILYISTNW